VEDYNPERGSGNGFAFDEYSAESLLLAVKRALRVYLEEEEWRILMERGMRADFSWRASAQKYVKLYELAKGGVRDEDSSLDFSGRSW
jgi:starch synthase